MKGSIDILKRFILGAMLSILLPSIALALELNDDGRSLIQEAAQAYSSDMRDRPVMIEPAAVSRYVTRVAGRLIPKDKKPPPGVSLQATVIDSPKPELYAYVDGHLVITTGMIFSMENEAQLAGVISHEIAQLVEGYYIQIYQEIKAAERKQRNKAAAGALLGALLDVAVDYAVDVQEIDATDRYMEGDATYGDTMKRLAAVTAAQSAYYSLKDVVASIPARDSEGRGIDPRLRFEPVSDAQGMVYLALAGYDVKEAPRGWDRIHRVNNRMAKEQEAMMGAFAEQLRATQGLMEMNMARLRQQLGASGLVQTLSSAPPSRSRFVAGLTRMEEVAAAEKAHGRSKEEAAYRKFIEGVLFPRAESALKEERFDSAYNDYRILYDRGVHTAPVAFGLAKSKLGDFAFGASPAELKEAEDRYLEAIRLDPDYAPTYRGLGEMYDDAERYEDAAEAYRNFLKHAPKTRARKKIERKIKVLERKASR